MSKKKSMGRQILEDGIKKDSLWSRLYMEGLALGTPTKRDLKLYAEFMRKKK